MSDSVPSVQALWRIKREDHHKIIHRKKALEPHNQAQAIRITSSLQP